MRGCRFLILLLIAIPLGWYAYYDSKKGAGRRHAEARQGVHASRPTRSTRSKSNLNLAIGRRCGRRAPTGKSCSPSPSPTDQAAVSGITSNLVFSRDSAGHRRESTGSEGIRPRRRRGSRSPSKPTASNGGCSSDRRRQPVRTCTPKLPDSKRVFLVPSFLDSTFNRSTFDLRDKSVLKVDREKVDSLEIATKDHTTRFEKKNGEWQIVQPAAGRAEFSAVDGLVSRVSSVQMKSIVPDATRSEEVRTRQTCRDRPAWDPARRRPSLALGSAAESGSVYAKDLSRPACSRSNLRWLTI